MLQVPGLAAGLWTTTGTDELELLVLAEVAAWVLPVELKDTTLDMVVGRPDGRPGGPWLGGPKLLGRPSGG